MDLSDFDRNDPRDLAKLAHELAKNIRERKDVLADCGLTAKDFAEIEKLDFYQRMFEASVAEWSKYGSTAERVRLNALQIIEDALPTMGGRMYNTKEPLTSVVEAGKFLARIGGMEASEKQTPASAADKFVITINMGADKIERYEKPLTIEPEKTPDAIARKAITGSD